MVEVSCDHPSTFLTLGRFLDFSMSRSVTMDKKGAKEEV